MDWLWKGPVPDMNKAIALLEVQAMVTAVTGLDAMLKASDVTAAAEAGREAAARVGKVKLCEVIANPHPEVTKFLYTD